jgi:hypothetical protein
VETKKVREFIDTGFGFPVRLLDVTMVKARGVWTPRIYYNKLAEWVLLTLSRRACPLTGNQVRFIRNHFEMTLQAFARRFGVTHAGVIKWESAGDHSTAMNWSTEKDIRMFIQSKLSADPEKVGDLYKELTTHPADRGIEKVPGVGPVRMNRIPKELAAAR